MAAGQTQAQTLPASEKANLASQANDFFRQANELYETDPQGARDLYSKALLRFEKLTRQGVQNGKLYYNIGNIYFRLDDIGRAILNYRRAETFMPDNPNLRQNLSYAISRRFDKIEQQQEEKIVKTLFFWHYDLPMPVRLTIFSIFYAGFWIFAAWKFLKSRPSANWGLGISLVCFSLFLGSLLTDRFTQADTFNGVLVAPEVVARKGDGRSYQPSFKEPLHAGTDFRMVENRGHWLYIELPDGRRCWVPSVSAEMITL